MLSIEINFGVAGYTIFVDVIGISVFARLDVSKEPFWTALWDGNNAFDASGNSTRLRV